MEPNYYAHGVRFSVFRRAYLRIQVILFMRVAWMALENQWQWDDSVCVGKWISWMDQQEARVQVSIGTDIFSMGQKADNFHMT